MENKYVQFTAVEGAPYSDMVVVEDKLLFLSGLVSEDLTTRDEVYGDITFETKRILDNLETILNKYGSGMDSVVRIDVILRTFAERNEMNAEYVKHFPADKMPARFCYGDVALAGECKVEMAVIAKRK